MSSSPHLRFALFVAGVLTLLVACGEGRGGGPICSSMGCVDGFIVDLTRDGERVRRWPPGRYVFTATVDGEDARCEATLPLPPCERSGSQCSGVLQVELSGCALPAEQHGFGSVLFGTAQVASVDLRIERDGQLIGTGSFQPSYTMFQPNGPRCDPTCHSSRAELELQEPAPAPRPEQPPLEAPAAE